MILKKFTALLLAVLLTLSFTACTDTKKKPDPEPDLPAVTEPADDLTPEDDLLPDIDVPDAVDDPDIDVDLPDVLPDANVPDPDIPDTELPDTGNPDLETSTDNDNNDS